jgi:hypothetical protein
MSLMRTVPFGSKSISSLLVIADIGFSSYEPTRLNDAALSFASFDSTHGTRIFDECRQIIEFREDGTYSEGQSLLLDIHTVVCC